MFIDMPTVHWTAWSVFSYCTLANGRRYCVSKRHPAGKGVNLSTIEVSQVLGFKSKHTILPIFFPDKIILWYVFSTEKFAFLLTSLSFYSDKSNVKYSYLGSCIAPLPLEHSEKFSQQEASLWSKLGSNEIKKFPPFTLICKVHLSPSLCC